MSLEEHPQAPGGPAPALQSFGHQAAPLSKNRGALYMVDEIV